MDRTDTVRNIMTTNVLSVQLDDPPSAVQALLRDRAFHHVPVLEGDVVVGILSAIDLARFSLEGYVSDSATVDAHLDTEFSIAELMSAEPASVKASDTIVLAAEMLSEGYYHALPVVDDEGRLLGLVTSTDLIRYMLATA
jgi:CBS domain-containing membrane protein